MENVARGWLVYDLTGSPLLLGLVLAARALPLLMFGMLGGVFADRYERKRQLILSQNANTVLAVGLGILIISGRVETWHVFVTAVLSGVVMSFQQTARQAMIPALVPREDLLNAVALNSGVVNITRTIGPALAGMLIALWGVGGSYLVEGGLFVVATFWTRRLRSDVPVQPEGGHLPMWRSFTGGLAYVRTNPVVLSLLLLALVPIVLAQPYQALVPVFARDVWDIGALGQGLLFSVSGVGAVFGAGLVARLDDSGDRGVVLVGGVITLGVAMIVFALSPFLGLAFAGMFVIGAANTGYRALNQGLLQVYTDDAYRGRVMSLYSMDRGLAPAGALLAGVLATLLGAQYAVAVLGFLTALFAIGMVILVPRFRGLEAHGRASRAQPAEPELL